MKKLFKEFKEFINKGSVLDLAVGMIIGAAFTAIITAVVNGILKPLINLIPIGETGLQTVLRPAVVDETTNTVLVEALILDWGAVISAIITFLLTALVLFIVIKAINTAKKKAEEAKAKLEAEQAAAAEAEEETEPEPEPEPAPTTEELLGKIIEILEKKE